MEPLVHKLARRFQAAFFNVGDIILYGKYKNKKGKIISFGKNDKGQPTVEIEPIPKGRKKNKVMGLFKIWNVSKKDEAIAEKQMQDEKNKEAAVVLRVAARFQKHARGLGLGDTATKGSIRVHRYSDMLKVWDLTNAGKRGKKVRVMSVGLSYSYKGDKQDWLERMGGHALDYGSYDRFKAFLSDLQHDFPGEIEIDENQSRGIDVLPAETREIKLKWTVGRENLDLKATPLEFLVNSSVLFAEGEGHMPPGAKSFRQDTLYWARKKGDAARFYSWLSANEQQVQKMDIQDLRKLWSQIDVRYDFH